MEVARDDHILLNCLVERHSPSHSQSCFQQMCAENRIHCKANFSQVLAFIVRRLWFDVHAECQASIRNLALFMNIKHAERNGDWVAIEPDIRISWLPTVTIQHASRNRMEQISRNVPRVEECWVALVLECRWDGKFDACTSSFPALNEMVMHIKLHELGTENVYWEYTQEGKVAP